MSEPLKLAYFDASALVKRYVEEPGSDRVRRLLARNLAATCRYSEIEISSALARRCREGDLTTEDRDRALAGLRQDLRSLLVVELTPAASRRCLPLLRRHPLRAGDALQLASCLEIGAQLGLPLLFVGFDQRLNEAAGQEGLDVAVPPS